MDPSPTKRRVLIMVENLSLPFDQRVWHECRSLVKAGYAVSAISPKGKLIDKKSHEVIDGVSIYRYRSFESEGGTFAFLLEFATAMICMAVLALVVFIRERFDVIHICNPPDTLILITLPYKLLGKKVIFDQHDPSPDIYIMHSESRKLLPILLWFEKLTFRYSEAALTVNETCREIALSRGGSPPETTYVVRNGPDLESIRSAQVNPALHCGKDLLVSYVGMLGPTDGVDILLRSVQYLRKTLGREDFHVHLMGGGTELESLKELAVELGVADSVTFTGRVTYDKVMEGIASADVCVAPDPMTPMNDRASLVKVVEYMSQGKPIVAFDLKEVRISAQEGALYATPDDETEFAEILNSLLDSPEMRKKVGDFGRHRLLTELCWEHQEKSLYKAYDAVFAMAGKA